jgi:serine/threonine protein kinase
MKKFDGKKVTLSSQKLHEQISILKNLNDPNIIKYYDLFENGDEICLVMEYVEGVNLNVFLKQKQHSLEESMIRKIIYKLFSGLSYLHGANQIHGRIKPENIL